MNQVTLSILLGPLWNGLLLFHALRILLLSCNIRDEADEIYSHYSRTPCCVTRDFYLLIPSTVHHDAVIHTQLVLLGNQSNAATLPSQITINSLYWSAHIVSPNFQFRNDLTALARMGGWIVPSKVPSITISCIFELKNMVARLVIDPV